MKIGILTFHHSLNYGAMLQAYCLQTYLQSSGHSVEFLDYNPAYLEQGGTFKSLLKVRLTRSYLKSLYLFYSSVICGLKYKYLASQFADFRSTCLNIGDTCFLSSSDFDFKNDLYDLIVIGSDQVWNPSDQYGLDSIYFGDPLYKISQRIISYAASFGSINRISPYLNVLPSLLRRFDDLSVRECSAQQFLSNLSIKSTLVPDPTFLVDDLGAFSKVSSHIPNDKKYGFFYVLRDAFNMHKFADSLVSDKNLDAIFSAATPWRRWKPLGVEVELSPFEFIGAIQYSEFTISNSFHGIVTSILTSTNFIAVKLPGSKSGLSSRISDLLECLGLSSRLVPAHSLCDSMDLLSSPINWSDVKNKVHNMRSFGQTYLNRNI